MFDDSLTPASDTLEVYLGRHRTTGMTVYLIIAALMCAAIASLPLLRLGVTVTSPGIIRPLAEKHDVRARTAGVAATVEAGLGEAVARGQPLVTLRLDLLDERRASLHRRLSDEKQIIADLELLTGSAVEIMTALDLTSPRYREERTQLLRELSEVGLRIEEAKAESARSAGLAENDLIARQEAERRTHALSQLYASREVLAGHQLRLWQAELLDAERRAAEIEAQLNELDQEARLYAIEAPVAGTVEELAAISPGSFVQAGDVVAVLSPDAEVAAEIFVPPADIGLLRKGMAVRILVDAFNYHEWGALTGRVQSIAGDYTAIDGSPVFRVQVALDSTRLALRNGTEGEIRKGMTVQARFVVGSRTLLDLLRDDVNDWLHPWDSQKLSMARER